MLRLRNMLTIVWCRFGSWGLVIKSNFYPEFQTLSTRFGQDFEVEAQARIWSWSLVSILLLWSLVKVMRLSLVVILKLRLVKILKFKFSWNADVWLRFWSWFLGNILKFDQDFRMTNWSYFGKQNSTLGSIVPLAMFFLQMIMACESPLYDELYLASSLGVDTISLVCHPPAHIKQ